MSEEIEYSVILLCVDKEKENEGLYKDLKPGLQGLAIRYEQEMAEITGKPSVYFGVLDALAAPGISTVCIAADRDYNVYGFIYIEFDCFSGTIWTSHVYVAKEVRKSGVYKTMMERVKKFAKDSGMNRIFSLVYTKNMPSMVAHAKQGFTPAWTGYEMEIK